MAILDYAAIAAASILFGLDKSLAPGAGMLAVALLTGLMPAHQATGITLIMAICADWCAIWAYRGNISFKTLFKLLPFVVLGILAGIGFLYIADNEVMKKTVGVILAIFVASYFIKKARETKATSNAISNESGSNGPEDVQPEPSAQTVGNIKAPEESKGFSFAKRLICGIFAGFTTMVANAAGPITSIFFLSENLPVMIFLGTTACFFLIVNLIKLPFSIALGMITYDGLLSMVWTVPLVLVTVLIGRSIAHRIDQRHFVVLIYTLAVIAVLKLLLF